MATKKKLDEILNKVSSGTLSVKSDVTQTRGDQNRSARGTATLSKPSKKVKLTTDISGEAWTRATPNQTKVPSTNGLTASQKTELSKLQEQRRQAQVDLDTNTMADLDRRMKAIRERAGVQTFGDRASDTASAIFSGSAGAYTNAAGFISNAFHDPDYNRRQIASMEKVLASGRTTDGKTVTPAMRKTIQESIDRMNAEIEKWESEDSTTNKLYRAADRMQDDSAAFQENAKQGLGKIGSTIVDAAVSAGQSMLDAVPAAVTGGAAGMVPFVARAFGGATQEARRNGADMDQQFLYGSAEAAKEWASEKVFGLTLPQKLMGKAGAGGLDGVIKSRIQKAVSRIESDFGQRAVGGIVTWLASGATEGAEEVLGDLAENYIINPNLRDWDPDNRTGKQKFEDGVYDFFVGAVSGLIGGATNLVSYQPGKAEASSTSGEQSQPVVDSRSQESYNTDTKTSPAASAEVQQMDTRAQGTQAANPDTTVLDAGTTLFVQQGMSAKKAQEKAAIVQKLIAGEEVSVRDINKLNPTSKSTQAIFTQLTGVQFPDGKLSTEQLYNLYRSANTVAVETRAQQRAQQAAREVEFQKAAMERVQSMQEPQETQTEQEQQTADTLAQQMAEAGFQANPETQERIAQAQAELNDAVNGTNTASTRKAGNARNSITLKDGTVLTRDQVKSVVRETYAARGVTPDDGQLDAMFNNLLVAADRGESVPVLDAMAEYLKEENNGGDQADNAGSGTGARYVRGPGSEENRGAESSRTSQSGRAVGEIQEKPGAAAEDRAGNDRGGETDRVADPVHSDDAVRSDSRGSGERRGSEEVRRGGQQTSRDGVLREVRGESGGQTEDGAGESVRDTNFRLAKRQTDAFRKKNYPTESADVGTGAENDILPEKYWSPGLRRAAKKIRAAGGKLYVSVGPVRYRSKNGAIKTTAGITIPGTKTIVVRADSYTKLPDQIAAHELLHLYMLNDPSFAVKLRYQVLESLGETSVDKFNELLRSNYSEYAYEYGDFEENYDAYLDEFLCDLNGNIRGLAKMPDGNFDALRSVVVQSVAQWESEQVNTPNTEQNSTSQGQPGEPRFSLTTEMTWDEQLDDLNNSSRFSALYIEETPNILAEVGLGDLPLCMTKAHMKDVLHEKDPSNPHWHGVPEGVIRRLPDLLSKPAMILRSASTPGDIVVVLQAADNDGNPIIAAIHPNGSAWVDKVVGPANFITSVYGRENFAPKPGMLSKNNLLYLALRDKGILYWNEKRTETLAHRCRLQLPQTLRKVPSDTILKQYEGYVKGKTPERLFSLEDDTDDGYDLDSAAPVTDEIPQFKSWDDAFMYFESLPGSNLAFAEPPFMTSEMELGELDSHGNWVGTVGAYSNNASGLAQFNKDVVDLLSADEISDEELNELFPPVDDYAEDYSVGEWDVPPDPAQSQMETEWEVQENRDGFSNTETKSFGRWFKDDSGELTGADGQPKVFLRGSIGMGATKAHDASEAKSKGIFFTTDPNIAVEYANGGSVDYNMTLMDAVKGRENDASKELKLKYFRGWGPAMDYILRHFQASGNGLRLIGLDASGQQVQKISQAERFSLQTNVMSEEELQTNGDFATGTWRELASYPKTKAGLESFNEELGDHIRNNALGIRGYGKFYLSAQNTLVVDAAGDSYRDISEDNLPEEVWSPKGTGYSHINGIVARAFKAGYDCVVVKNVRDLGGIQNQYVVKNSSQVKSVYNRGTWDNSRPDFLFSMADSEDHRQKLEDFFKKLEEEYGDGSAEAMFQTFEQLDRARQRAEERAADAEAAQQAAEWATEAAVEAAKMAERERADKKLQKQKDSAREKARQKAAEARLSKAKAVRDARLAEQMNAGRQWAAKLRRQEERATAKAEAMRKDAQERMDQLRAGHQQELDDTRLAERMNAGRKVAAAKRRGQDAVARERDKRIQDHKLASKDAKTAASVLRKYHKTDTEKLTNAPVETLREAYHKPTVKDTVKAAADKLRTAHREFYKAFINGTQAIDDFSKYQKVDANTSVLLRTAMSANCTVQSIRKDHLVGKDGSVIDERSLEDVVICWDGSGKHRKYNDDKQRVLQDYMLHRHNIDRMSFREKALNAVESYEQSYPWLTSLEPREFAELVADGNRIAQRYQELIEQFQKAKDKPIFTDTEGKPVTAEFSKNLVSQYEQQYAWVKEKAEGIYDWWDKFMQEWVVGDSLSAEEYATLRETYPSYVPTYRKDKPGLGKGVSSFGGTVTAKKAVRAATGGTSAVANIEDSFNMLMEKNVSSQRTNMVLRSITDTAMLDETGDFNGFAIFDWNEAPEMLRWGLAAEGFEGALEAGTDLAAANALSDEGGGKYRVRAWANGQRVSAFVDEEIYKALEFAFNQKTGWFTKVGQTLTNPMKTFITGINPAFAVRNTIRDNLTAQMNSISVVNSISGIKFEKYYAKAWQEMVSGSDNWQHFVALGGTNAGYYNNEGGTYITNLNRQKMQDLNPVNKVGKALGFIGEHTEQVTRFAEYLATIDRLPGGDTYGNRLVGIKNAAEVTVDFSRKGTLGKAFNAWIPYWNPTVQGIDKVVRTFFDQPTVAGKAKVLSRAALTTLPLDILLFAIYHALDRDDEWEELSDRTKDTYYCIPLPAEHKFLKIPKSRDWGQIIGNPIMRMLQGLDGREDPFENYFEVSIKPNFLWSNPLDAVLLSTQYDLAKNEDFAGRSIVPSNYQKMAKGDQWNSDTSKYAKVIADIGNMFVKEDVLSPMQIDYVINDYFGDFGSMFQRLFSIGGNDKNLSAEEQAKLAAEDLFGNWVADNRYSSASVSDYYDMLDKVSQEVAAERVQNPDGYKDTPMYKLNSAFNSKGSASDQITELNAKVRELPDGPEKDEIKGQIVELAREALQMYDAVMSGDITEPKMEMEYSKYGDKVKTELTDLADYSEDYAFLPSDYKPSSYTDPKNKNKEYVLDDAAKEKYRELYDEEYASVMEAVIKSSKYRSASAEKRAELLEAARDDVAPQVKEEFLKWLAKNYKSTPKKK